jgi:hypothetical protein
MPDPAAIHRSVLRLLQNASHQGASAGIVHKLICELVDAEPQTRAPDRPFFLTKQEYKAVDRRRLLTENGLSSFNLESRFYAVLSKAAQVV